MKIICIWENYKDKKRVQSVTPVFYFKPETTLLLNNRPFYFPEYSDKIVCNIQLVLKICKVGKYIQQKFAQTYYDDIALGLSLTAKDIQKKCIKENLPLDSSYCFDGSSPLSHFINKNEFEDIKNISCNLNINDKTYDEFNSKDLFFNFDKIISDISKYMMIKTGDILFIGPVCKPVKIKINDKIEGFLNGKSLIKFKIS